MRRADRRARRRSFRAILVAGLGVGAAAGLVGCVPPGPAVEVTPEAALGGCEAGTLAELRRGDPAVQAVTLDPLDSARVERRTPPPGGEGVGLVIAGRGRAEGGIGPLRYTCLVGTGGEILFVDIDVEGDGEALAECRDRQGGDARSCLRQLMAGADTALAKAEAGAVVEGRRRHGAGAAAKRAEIDEPAAASIGAWRVYRDAECARRHGAVGGASGGDPRETACLVELTRARIRELGG